MSVRATVVFCALVASAALLVPSARATTMPERSAAELATASALVVEGTVLDARVQVLGGRIVTLRTVRVERVLRSALAPGEEVPATLVVALPGGELGGVGQRVAGTPALEVGARYVLCLSAPVVLGARTVVGLWQGVWRVGAGDELVPFTHAGPAAQGASRAALLHALGARP